MPGERIKPQPCPKCLKIFDAVTVVAGEGAPKPGDLAVCAYCATILVFDASTTQRIACMQDVVGLEPEIMKALSKAQRAVIQMRGLRN